MPDGSVAQVAMRLAMRDGGIEPSQVGYINAHGTSTPHGDAAETAAVKAVFGDRAKKLIFGSTKSMTGHLLGAPAPSRRASAPSSSKRGSSLPLSTSSRPIRPATSTRRPT